MGIAFSYALESLSLLGLLFYATYPLTKKILMNELKIVFPFLAALDVYFLALNSPIYQQINQPHSIKN
tara:strand:+ start:900 stop:1103 length:204 start_codon:yes stop_codon:yes gene_type:complete